MSDLTFTHIPADRLPAAEREAVLQDPGFGKVFTDHMVSIEWTREEGWHNAQVLPYGPIPMDPAASVLHYGQEIFEGLKAYRHPNGQIVTFRPQENAERLNGSARRLALPEIPVELFIRAVDELVRVDQDWVPSGSEQSLYIRPFMIADESFLGVRAAERARFIVIASPAGSYFAGGVRPVSIWLSDHLARAGHGGTGAAKCGGNYASSLLPTRIAYENGCQQVLFTDSNTTDTIDELGGMNLFLVRGNTLITPALNGNILDGITRKSIIRLAQEKGLAVEERAVTVSEWVAGVKDGSITEAFACGTAAVVTPVGRLLSEAGELVNFGDAAPGKLTMEIRAELTGIQFGTVEDRFGWVHPVVVA